MKKQITVANLVMLVGGAVTFLFSFLSFYKFGSEGRSAWSGDLLFPETAIPAILGLAMAVVAVLDLTGVKLPDHVLTFNWKQINVTWGIAAAGIMLGWLFTGQTGTDKGIGLILMLIGSLAMAAGSIMAILGMGGSAVNLPQSGNSGSAGNSGNAGSAGSSSAVPPPPPPGAGTPPPPPPPV